LLERSVSGWLLWYLKSTNLLAPLQSTYILCWSLYWDGSD